MKSSMSLHELGILHKTDKAADHPIHGQGHGFCKFYDQHLSSIRFDNLKILEIGIFDGASLKMWEDYFENSKIYGIDILMDPRAKLINNGRITSFKMDQGNVNDLTKLSKEYGPFDIVIDDGSHFAHHQWISWKLFSDSPVFIWEDLHTSRYSPHMNMTNSLGESPLDFAKRLSTTEKNCFLFDRDGDEKHVTFIRINK